MIEREKKRRRFFSMMENERDRQDEKHPRGFKDGTYPSRTTFMTVLAAEVGEVADAILEHDRENQIAEVVQVAAVCLRAYEELL